MLPLNNIVTGAPLFKLLASSHSFLLLLLKKKNISLVDFPLLFQKLAFSIYCMFLHFVTQIFCLHKVPCIIWIVVVQEICVQSDEILLSVADWLV